MIIVVSGATGGHLYPAIALVEQLNQPSLFLVSRQNPVASILEPYCIPYKVLPFSIKKWWRLIIDAALAFKYLIKYRPKVIFLMGGGLCVPLAIIAKLLRINLVSFEQNTIPGRATRIVQWLANAIITTFESTASRLRFKSKINCLGNPIRLPKKTDGPLHSELLKIKGKTIVIIGGSQGAKSINDFISSNKTQLLNDGYNIIHLAGENYFKNNLKSVQLEEVNGKRYIALPYCHNMPALYKIATHIICRAGATTLSELLSYGIPSILVPFPFAKDDHQRQNAIEFEQMVPNATLLDEANLNLNNITNILNLPSTKKIKPLKKAEETIFSICEFLQTYLK